MISPAQAQKRIAKHVQNLAHSKKGYRAECYLVRYGGRAVDALIKACSHRRPEARYRAVWALGLIGNRRAYETVLRLTSDPDQSVRYDAAWALGKLGDRRAIAPLIRWLNGPVSDSRNCGAAQGLGDMGALAVPALVANLRKGTLRGRLTAASILEKSGDEDCIPALAQLLSNPNKELRIAGMEALALIEERKGHKCSRRYIERCLKDPVQEVRENAAHWLKHLRSGKKFWCEPDVV